MLALAANLARRLGAALAVLLKLRATVAALDDHHLETARLNGKWEIEKQNK